MSSTQTTARAPAISVKEIFKRFSVKDGAIVALTDVTTEIPGGQFVSILGPSGCGKSTLLSIIAGLETASQGSVRVGDVVVDRPYVDAGMVFQKDLLLEWRSSLDNILLQFEMRGENPRPHKDEALQLLRLVGMEGFANQRPYELSGGMRQRVSICRALVHDPKILFMDEPFGALDAITRDQLNLDLARLTGAGGKTVLFVTHSIKEAVFLSDRVLVMSPRPGRIVADVLIDIGRPRETSVQDSESFVRYERQLREILDEAGVYGGPGA